MAQVIARFASSSASRSRNAACTRVYALLPSNSRGGATLASAHAMIAATIFSTSPSIENAPAFSPNNALRMAPLGVSA